MDDDEIALYRFRVGRMHFQEFADACNYAQLCLDATTVEFQHRFTNREPVWRVLWTDGDVQFNRPGFGVLEPYKGRGKL